MNTQRNNDLGIEVLMAIMQGDLGSAREILEQAESQKQQDILRERINLGIISQQDIDNWNEEHSHNRIEKCHECKTYHFFEDGDIDYCEHCEKWTCQNCINEIGSVYLCNSCTKEYQNEQLINKLKTKLSYEGLTDYESLIEYIALNNIELGF